MVSWKSALRLVASIGALMLVAGAAIAVHALALKLTREERLVSLGPVSEWILTVLFALLIVLALRHLVMLGLAAYDHATQAATPPGDDASEQPPVSIVVPAFNEGAMIRSVLESLLASDYPRFEVIVVDDGSSDHTFLRSLPYRRHRPGIECRVLAKPNGGKFDALNHGIAQAHGEIVVCIDGDSLLHPDALRQCVRHFADPRIGAVAGNVRVVNRRTPWSALQALEYIAGYGLTKRAQSAARVVTIVPGPLGAFRKSALSQVGGYEGDTFAEDFDLTLKLLAAGWHVVYEPRAVVRTEAPERALELLRQRYRWTRGSLQVLLKRRAGLLAPRRAPLRFIALWYLVSEYLAWPVLHIAAHTAFVGGALVFGVHEMMVCWWLQLIVLESAVAAFCVAVEDESPWLIALGPVFRIGYLVVLDVARLLASAEEFARVGMTWDKVSRIGRLKPSSL